MRHRRASIVCGCLTSALAASIIAVKLPYYALFASAALIVVFAVWLTVLARTTR
ncbi:hypothetical protein [Actinoplanes couchii]|uniref:Uncharacterized protein n=1 Tax=Actinoplanes couchii TaxID=403638 RepID=A0ABQ3XHD5_9ACTN|nr:hypothetical protein [Actinoplanes couchii]MDR6320689.1 putative Ca2+/H+ antiporter (TMEM165/GDT1 family) [Actinoplanes couchii]GID57825.1 hypothetical protein Aco03nite_062290 [Actinoplanes couchii]